MAECSNLLNQEVLQQTDTLHPTSSCYCRNKDPSDSLAKLLPVVAAVVAQPTTTEAYLGQQWHHAVLKLGWLSDIVQ